MKFDEIFEMYRVEDTAEKERLTNLFFNGMNLQMKTYLGNFCKLKGYGNNVSQVSFKTFYVPQEREFDYFPERSVLLLFSYSAVAEEFEPAGFFISYEEFYTRLVLAVSSNLERHPSEEREEYAKEKLQEIKIALEIQ